MPKLDFSSLKCILFADLLAQDAIYKKSQIQLCKEIFLFIFGTTLAQNFHKLTRLCDLHGKSSMLK